MHRVRHRFGWLHESEKRWFDTRELCSSWRDYEFLPINASVQMDVDEFYNMLFEGLEGALKGGPCAQLLQGLFGGTIVNQIVSKDSRMLSEREEIFYTIPVDIICIHYSGTIMMSTASLAGSNGGVRAK